MAEMYEANQMKKHAYLIECHNNYELLKQLLHALDDNRNDIYIHLSKKSKNFPFEEVKKTVKLSDVIFVKRHNVTWGGYSQIKAEMELLKTAIKKEYCYYHLISGVDFPLKSQKYIHDFFDKNDGKNFVKFELCDEKNIKFSERIKYYYFFQERIGKNITGIEWILHRYFLKLQRKLNIDRLRKIPFDVYKGSNWFSITHESAKYIVLKEKIIRTYFSHSIAADELFLQTILLNSKFRNKIINDNMRYIEWKTGSPCVFQLEDYGRLIETEALFARKFSYNSEGEKELIERLKMHVV